MITLSKYWKTPKIIPDLELKMLINKKLFFENMIFMYKII